MTTTIQTNKRILDFAYNFKEIVKKEKWVSRYDIESDSLSLTVSKLPNDARIKYFDNEVAFYFTKNNNIKGIFIEYFKSNFIKHHKELKGLLKDTKQKEKTDTLIELKKTEMNEVIPEIEETIQESLAENIQFQQNNN